MPARAYADGSGTRRGRAREEALGILESLRRIIRAVEIYSKRLAAEHGVTAPQILCLRALDRAGGLAPTGLAREVHLSASTVIGILDRLEARALVRREREEEDRRRVRVTVTPAGRTILRRTPALLQERLAAGLRGLPEGERAAVSRALRTVVDLMEAGEVEAAPVLTTESLGGRRHGSPRGRTGREDGR